MGRRIGLIVFLIGLAGFIGGAEIMFLVMMSIGAMLYVGIITEGKNG